MNITRLLSTTALVLSLAVAGMAYAADNPDTHDNASASEEHHQHSLPLPPEKAKLFREAMQSAREKNKPIEEQIRKLHEEQNTILTADKFDKSAFLAKNAELDKAYAQMRENMTQAFVSVADQFTADERKALVKMHRGGTMMRHGEEGAHHGEGEDHNSPGK